MPVDNPAARATLRMMTGTGLLAKRVPISVKKLVMATSKAMPSLSLAFNWSLLKPRVLVSSLAVKRSQRSLLKSLGGEHVVVKINKSLGANKII